MGGNDEQKNTGPSSVLFTYDEVLRRIPDVWPGPVTWRNHQIVIDLILPPADRQGKTPPADQRYGPEYEIMHEAFQRSAQAESASGDWSDMVAIGVCCRQFHSAWRARVARDR